MKGIVNTLSLFALAAGLLLAGCDRSAMIQKIATDADKQFAQACIADLRDGRYSDLIAKIDTSLWPGDIKGAAPRLAALIPAGDPKSSKLVGAVSVYSNGHSFTNLTYEYEYPGTWLLITVGVEHVGNQAEITGIGIVPLQDSIENIDTFSFAGKNFGYYFMFGSVILLPLFTLAVLVKCILTKPLKRKWLWIIFIVFGFGMLSLNWATGEWGFKVVSFQLFSAGAQAMNYSPWIFSISLPLGAIVFLLRGLRKTTVDKTEQKIAS